MIKIPSATEPTGGAGEDSPTGVLAELTGGGPSRQPDPTSTTTGDAARKGVEGAGDGRTGGGKGSRTGGGPRGGQKGAGGRSGVGGGAGAAPDPQQQSDQQTSEEGEEWLPPEPTSMAPPPQRIPPHLYRSATSSGGAYRKAREVSTTRWREFVSDIERMRNSGVGEDEIAVFCAQIRVNVPARRPE